MKYRQVVIEIENKIANENDKEETTKTVWPQWD